MSLALRTLLAMNLEVRVTEVRSRLRSPDASGELWPSSRMWRETVCKFVLEFGPSDMVMGVEREARRGLKSCG